MDYSFLKDKTVLVTGGTGTFGKAFISRLLNFSSVKKIIVFSRDEFKQHEMRLEISDPQNRLRFFLGDVRDLSRLERAFEGVDIVVHAAALKQVPATEYNPLEAVKTNIIGTQNVIDAALNKKVDKVLLVSSDKAVHPINLYGATKLCAERLFISANAYTGQAYPTKFSVIRYGNVIGSRGSLVELIKRQREKGIITLTDERMTRFWIKVDQVMNMVLEAVSNMRGGEIFIPKMKNMKIVDVIKALAPSCRIEVIGIRPGEKMHEILITEHEMRRTKDTGNMFAILPEFEWYDNKNMDSLPTLPSDFNYESNNEDLILSTDEVSEILK